MLRGDSGSGKSLFLAKLADVHDAADIANKTADLPNTPTLPPFIYVPQQSHFRQRLTVRAECLAGWGKFVRGLRCCDLVNCFPMEQLKALTEINREEEIQPGDVVKKYLPKRFDELVSILAPNNEDFPGKRIAELSGGERKRFALLYKLLFTPDVLILDEPDTGIDVENAKQLLNALRDNKDGILFPLAPPAILITTHHESLQDHFKENLVEIGSTNPKDQSTEESGPGAEDESPAPSDAASDERATGKQPLLSQLKGFAAAPVERAIQECLHHLKLSCSLSDVVTLILAPILIYVLLGLPTEWLYVSDRGVLPDGFERYTLFCVVAAIWMGVQIFSKWPVENFRILQEEYRWAANIRSGGRVGLWTVLLGVLGGLCLFAFLTALLQGFLGASAYHLKTSQSWAWDEFFLTFLTFLDASYLGALLGFALGGMVSFFCLGFPAIARALLDRCGLPSRILNRLGIAPRPPNMVAINLLIPLLMLGLIIFTGPYLEGWEAEDVKTPEKGEILSWQIRMARRNPTHRYELALEQNWKNAPRRAALGKEGATSFYGHGWPPVVCASFALVLASLGLLSILKAPEVRVE